MELTHEMIERAFPAVVLMHGKTDVLPGPCCDRCRDWKGLALFNGEWLCPDCRMELYSASLSGRKPEMPYRSSFNRIGGDK